MHFDDAFFLDDFSTGGVAASIGAAKVPAFVSARFCIGEFPAG